MSVSLYSLVCLQETRVKNMLNNIVLVGNLGADPEVFFSSEGDQVTSFDLAFRASKKSTGWIKVTCFNNVAEIASTHLQFDGD
jgi:single-strand DNA-binding protein